MFIDCEFVFELDGYHRYLHVLTHSFPTRRSSDLLHRAVEAMAGREQHRVADANRDRALTRAAGRGLHLSGEQRAAFDHVTDRSDLSIVDRKSTRLNSSH